MKLKDVKQVSEMARVAAVCANCGKPKTGGHYYYQGGFRCKGGTGKAFAPVGGASTPVSSVEPEDMSNDDTDATITATPAAPAAKIGKTPAATVAATTSPGPEATKAALDKWLKSHGVESYKMNEDGFIDVDGEVRLDSLRMPKLPGPVKFGTVAGDFICSSAGLTTLTGCPQHVGVSEFGGDFMCDHNELVSLEGGPRTVGGSYSFSGNDNIDSIQHLAEKIGGNVYAKDLPKLKSLQGIHKVLKECGGFFDASGTNLESHVLGLLMVKGLDSVKLSNDKVTAILNKHLKMPDRNAHECQEELFDAGFANFAKL